MQRRCNAKAHAAWRGLLLTMAAIGTHAQGLRRERNMKFGRHKIIRVTGARMVDVRAKVIARVLLEQVEKPRLQDQHQRIASPSSIGTNITKAVSSTLRQQ